MSIPQPCGRCGCLAYRLYGTFSAVIAALERVSDGRQPGPAEAWVCRDCAGPAVVRAARGTCADHAHDGDRCLFGQPYAGDERAGIKKTT